MMLETAQQLGPVHRDLKPENLFVTADDRVKILDFGRAKLKTPALDKSIKEFRGDARRVYLTGPSAGGNGSWFRRLEVPPLERELVLLHEDGSGTMMA